MAAVLAASVVPLSRPVAGDQRQCSSPFVVIATPTSRRVITLRGCKIFITVFNQVRTNFSNRGGHTHSIVFVTTF